MSEVTRAAIVESAPLPRRAFKVLAELGDMYRDTVERLAPYAVGNGITKFARLKAEKYHEVKSLHPRLPSHYAYTACHDAAGRAHSFLRLRKGGRVRVPVELNRHYLRYLNGGWRLSSEARLRLDRRGRGWYST